MMHSSKVGVERALENPRQAMLKIKIVIFS
jgi:hypothetical protein